jgi:hypothetical protein
MNKSSARLKYNVNIQLGLINIGYHNYVSAIIQNMTAEGIILRKGTTVAQILPIKCKIPILKHDWPTTYSTRGGFESTGQNFQNTNINNITQQAVQFKTEEIIKDEEKFLKIVDYLGPQKITINNLEGKQTMPEYTLKKGIVCKTFKETDSQEPRLAIYIPTFLLILSRAHI